jgi:type I restriction enzyme, S subunit
MTTSEKFRQLRNGPVGFIAKYYCDIYLKDTQVIPLNLFVKEIKTGKTPSKANSLFYDKDDFSWFKPSEIGSTLYVDEAKEKLSNYAVENNQVTIFKAGTLLINCIGDIGRLAILKNDASSNQQITGILFTEKVLPEYAYFYFLGRRDLLEDDVSSTTLPIINQKKLLNLPFKKPDIKDQEKIIALLKYCWDCVEEKIIPDLRNFDFNKFFIKQCIIFFDTYYTQVNLVKEFTKQYSYLHNLRQAILQEAVQGKLTQQNKADEPASTLLQRIKAEKQKLIAAGKIKKEKELPPITKDEIPFELPKGWVWCRLGEVIYNSEAGKSLVCDKREAEFPEWGIIKVSAMSWGNFDEKENKALLPNVKPTLQYKINKGDYLISRANTEELIGKSVIVGDIKSNLLLSDKSIRITFSDLSNIEYINFYNNSTIAREYYKLVASGTSDTMKNITREQMYMLPFPLPPLAEQHSIVTKVQQLLQMTNQLDKQVAQSQTQAQQLLQAVLKEAFSSPFAALAQEGKKGMLYQANGALTMAAEPEVVYKNKTR